ncbi:MAG: hypothetical protein IKP28_04200 [Clostridia bacterium]|nr:hypothetical protein [Clostridia bacterium]
MNKIKKLFGKVDWLVLLVFFYFNFTFTIKNISTINNLLIYAICIIYLCINYKLLWKIVKNIPKTAFFLTIISFIICALAAVIIPIIYKTNDFSYTDTLLSIPRTGIKLLFIVVLMYKRFDGKIDTEKFSKYYVATCVLYFISTLIFICIPSLKYFWNDIINDSSFAKYEKESYYITRYGLMGFSGFQVAFKFAIACCLSVYLIMTEQCKIKKQNIWIYISYVALIAGTFMYGRIGMVASLINSIFLVIAVFRQNKKLLLFLLLTIIIFSLVAAALYNMNKTTQKWVKWAFAPFISLFETGKIYTGSSDIVFNRMIFMPETKTLFLGDGLYKDPNGKGYYKHTDVGFMRPTLFYGCILTAIGYMIAIIPMISVIKSGKKEKNSNLVLLMLMLFNTLIVFEIKGEIFYRLAPLIITYLIIKNIEGEKKEIERN